MILYRTPAGPVVECDGRHHAVDGIPWDDLLNDPDLVSRLRSLSAAGSPIAAPSEILTPVASQEVWAAGVTYFRSRTARMEESRQAGGASFYDRVYEADRPEIFFKANPRHVAAPGAPLHRRADSKWIVPEPELTLLVNRRGRIVGYTCGNDLSCRDIEGENPLYLPQAKVFRQCAALGPGILVTEEPLPKETAIRCEILRGDTAAFSGATTLAQMKRTPEELAAWLCREDHFPQGCFLMTGTGIVPPDDFSLQSGDEVRITIEGIGTLANPVD